MTTYHESSGGPPFLRPTLKQAGRPPAKPTDTTEQKKAALVKRVASIRTKQPTPTGTPPKKKAVLVPGAAVGARPSLRPERKTYGSIV